MMSEPVFILLATIAYALVLVTWHRAIRERDMARRDLRDAKIDVENLTRQVEGLRYLQRRDSRGRFLGIIEEAAA
jgi:hypothetical protein